MVQPDKASLRRHFASAIAALPQRQRRAEIRRLHRRVLGLSELERAHDVLLCLSFGDEPDTWSLVSPLVERGLRLWIPRTVPRGRALELVAWPCALETRTFGLQEPARHLPALPPAQIDRTLDAALILGLAFDREGLRLGHGAGYFDRFLAGRRFATIGLALSVQLTATLPRESHDVPLSLVVTPDEVVRAGDPPAA